MSGAGLRRRRTLLLVFAAMLAAAPFINWHLQLTPEDPLSFAPTAAGTRTPDTGGAGSWQWLDTGIETIPSLETMQYTTLDFSPDGSRLAALWSDGVRIFDATTRERIAWLPLVQARAAVFTPDSRALLVSRADRMETWAFDPPRAPRRWRDGADGGELALDPARRYLLVSTGAWDAELVDLAHAGTRTALHHPQSAPGRAAFACGPGAVAADGAWAAGGASTLRGPCVWDARSGAIIRAELYAAPSQPRTRCAADPRGRFLAVSDRLGFHVFATNDWREVFACSAEMDDTRPNALAFSPDGRTLAIPIARRTVRLLSTESWKPLAEFTPSEPLSIAALAFSPGGEKLVAAALDGRAGWWTLDAAPPPSATTAAFALDPALCPEARLNIQPPVNRTGCLDLGAFFDARLDRTWLDPREPGNDLADLPRGEQRLGDVWFDVRALAQISGARLRGPCEEFPVELRGLRVDRKCTRLHFLHACADAIDGVPDTTCVGEYRVRYADGASKSIPLRLGWELVDWWVPPPAGARPGMLAWTGSNGVSRTRTPTLKTHLYRFTWTNPRPGIAIATLDFCSAMTPAAPLLLGVSTEEAE